MSNTLRRPMFRGGPVDSYNTGITSGLDDSGYADGGRIGFEGGGLTPRPSFFSRAASSARYYNPLTEAGIGNIARGAYNTIAPGIARAGVGTVAAYPLLSTLAVPAATIGGMAYLNRPKNESELRFMQENDEITSKETTDPNLYEGYLKGRAEAREAGKKIGEKELGFFETFGKAKENIKLSQGPEPESELDKLKKFYEDQLKQKEAAYKAQIEELSVKPTEEEDITKQAKLYQKLLGGDEAKSQAVYDALLAASPAFFKGKNLREAAPEVLTAINKSGAFDKPRDIKQAAAQLAIQRNILKDKAIAEQKAKLDYYDSHQKKKDIFDIFKEASININSFGGSYEKNQKSGTLEPNKYYITNDQYLVGTQKDKKGNIISIPYPSRID